MSPSPPSGMASRRLLPPKLPWHLLRARRRRRRCRCCRRHLLSDQRHLDASTPASASRMHSCSAPPGSHIQTIPSLPTSNLRLPRRRLRCPTRAGVPLSESRRPRHDRHPHSQQPPARQHWAARVDRCASSRRRPFLHPLPRLSLGACRPSCRRRCRRRRHAGAASAPDASRGGRSRPRQSRCLVRAPPRQTGLRPDARRSLPKRTHPSARILGQCCTHSSGGCSPPAHPAPRCILAPRSSPARGSHVPGSRRSQSRCLRPQRRQSRCLRRRKQRLPRCRR
mmetsp:Transcript_7749/g.20013  ORF Transcript_7749/g.20013 Transcript_7749/m.20013 type:complete len:281 (-) Transcript_7749:165-1007(-)